MTKKSDSPYLNNNNRLGDVIAAIQVMGKYGFYKLDVEKWAMRISGDESKSEHWKNIFTEHPEFFRFETKGQEVSLVWRRSYRKRYSVDFQKEISFENYQKLECKDEDTDEERTRKMKALGRISRIPLTSEEISVLLNTAVNLHARAIEQNREYRYLTPLLFSLLGAALGAFLVWLGK